MNQQEQTPKIDETEVNKGITELADKITNLIIGQDNSTERKIASVHALALVLAILTRAIAGNDKARETAIMVLDKALRTLEERT